MDQERTGQLIKNLRIKNGLTQKQLADKYHVTYQAVSKWENGKNMPDISLLKQMSQDFEIPIEYFLEGKINKRRIEKKEKYICGLLVLVGLLFIFFVWYSREKDEFQFKTLSSSCDNFMISGNITYNSRLSAIYITNIQYCGGDDAEVYKKIECILYEEDGNVERKISSYESDNGKERKLEDFLKEITFAVNYLDNHCPEYKNDTLYLAIHATNVNDQVIQFKIPLKLDDRCKKADATQS